jgi:hypothetical protein
MLHYVPHPGFASQIFLLEGILYLLYNAPGLKANRTTHVLVETFTGRSTKQASIMHDRQTTDFPSGIGKNYTHIKHLMCRQERVYRPTGNQGRSLACLTAS